MNKVILKNILKFNLQDLVDNLTKPKEIISKFKLDETKKFQLSYPSFKLDKCNDCNIFANDGNCDCRGGKYLILGKYEIYFNYNKSKICKYIEIICYLRPNTMANAVINGISIYGYQRYSLNGIIQAIVNHEINNKSISNLTSKIFHKNGNIKNENFIEYHNEIIYNKRLFYYKNNLLKEQVYRIKININSLIIDEKLVPGLINIDEEGNKFEYHFINNSGTNIKYKGIIYPAIQKFNKYGNLIETNDKFDLHEI